MKKQSYNVGELGGLLAQLLSSSVENCDTNQADEQLENGIDNDDKRPLSVEKIVYSIEEAAYALGVSKPTMYDLTKLDNFPCFRIGKRIVVGVEALRNWVNIQCTSMKGLEEG